MDPLDPCTQSFSLFYDLCTHFLGLPPGVLLGPQLRQLLLLLLSFLGALDLSQRKGHEAHTT